MWLVGPTKKLIQQHLQTCSTDTSFYLVKSSYCNAVEYLYKFKLQIKATNIQTLFSIRETIKHLAYLLTKLRNSNGSGTTLILMTKFIGEICSLLRILQATCVAVIYSFLSSLLKPDITKKCWDNNHINLCIHIHWPCVAR